MFETLKNVLPSRRELDFYKIAFFEFDGKNIKKSSKNRWIFRSKFLKIRLKIALKTLSFLEDVFSGILSGFGMVLGRVWEAMEAPRLNFFGHL